MKELNMNKVQEVNGGIWQDYIPYFAGAACASAGGGPWGGAFCAAASRAALNTNWGTASYADMMVAP